MSSLAVAAPAAHRQNGIRVCTPNESISCSNIFCRRDRASSMVVLWQTYWIDCRKRTNFSWLTDITWSQMTNDVDSERKSRFVGETPHFGGLISISRCVVPFKTYRQHEPNEITYKFPRATLHVAREAYGEATTPWTVDVG